MRRYVLVLLPVMVACSRGGEEPLSWEGDAAYVADDAGRIPLTTPGTATMVERPVVEIPLPPLEEVPAPVAEEPLDVEVDPIVRADSIRLERGRATPSRQQAPLETLPEVQRPAAPPAPPPPTVQPSAPPPPPAEAAPTPPAEPATAPDSLAHDSWGGASAVSRDSGQTAAASTLTRHHLIDFHTGRGYIHS